jgi:hypothetical protein
LLRALSERPPKYPAGRPSLGFELRERAEDVQLLELGARQPRDARSAADLVQPRDTQRLWLVGGEQSSRGC